ncbi:hypothetical protein ABW19_dt0208354 [Dactylella cylindrospora]|nr:hypothetical protein ABW19_dt0208354 [Dactylella cylindrospora]
MSLSSGSPPPLDISKRYSKRDRTPSPTRRHSSRKLRPSSTREFDQPEIGLADLPTPPPSRKATPAHHHRPRESSRNLSTIKEDAPERGKSKSRKHHHKHRTPEEKEERKRRKAREAEEARLEELRRNQSKTPVLSPPTRTPPPPPIGQEVQPPISRRTTPAVPSRRDAATPATQFTVRGSAANILQTITDAFEKQKGVGSRSSKDQLDSSPAKSSGTRVVLEQNDSAIRVKVDSGSPNRHIHNDEAGSTESDESECHTPKGAEFPIPKSAKEQKNSIPYPTNVKIVGEDVSDDLAHHTENIDFLLPYGGLQEQFDSGYEIERDADDEDEELAGESDDRTISQPARQKSRSGLPPLTNSVVNVDPLSQQLPVLLSLVDNTISAYETILETQGSFAVGIGGYQPVARRLLEKVGKLFSRDLPPEAATWGEALEYFGGRKQIPEIPDIDYDDDGAVSEFFDHNDEKMFIFNACLEEPEVLDPAIDGLTKLMDEDVTPEETAIFLTAYPHLRPLLLACKDMTDDELDLLYSERARAFLNVDVAVRSDKQREITECAELSKGIDDTLKQLETVMARMKSVQSDIQKRKKGIEAQLAPHVANDDQTPDLPAEIQTAIDEIQNEDMVKMEERKRRRKEMKKEAEAEDDADTLLPDDSISQINPYRARYIPNNVQRAYYEAQTRAAASAARVPGSVVSTKTSTSILQDYLASKAPPRQTQFDGTQQMMASSMLGPNQGPMMGVKKPNAYVKLALPIKMYGSLKDAVRRFPLHHSSSRNLDVIQEKGETPDLRELYEDPINRSGSRSSTKVPSRNVSGASKKSGFLKRIGEAVEGERAGSPVIVAHTPVVGGYGSSKPVIVTNEAGAVNIKKDERDRSKRRRDKERKSSGSRRRDSHAGERDRPRRPHA